jgi:transcriptional regulator with XRE-family HTH domain
MKSWQPEAHCRTPLPKLLLRNLKSRLRADGVTYAELARRLKLSVPTIKRDLSRGTFSLVRLDQICSALRITLEDLRPWIAVDGFAGTGSRPESIGWRPNSRRWHAVMPSGSGGEKQLQRHSRAQSLGVLRVCAAAAPPQGSCCASQGRQVSAACARSRGSTNLELSLSSLSDPADFQCPRASRLQPRSPPRPPQTRTASGTPRGTRENH